MVCVCSCIHNARKLRRMRRKKEKKRSVGYLTLCEHNPIMVLPPTSDCRPLVFFQGRIGAPIIFIVKDFDQTRSCVCVCVCIYIYYLFILPDTKRENKFILFCYYCCMFRIDYYLCNISYQVIQEEKPQLNYAHISLNNPHSFFSLISHFIFCFIFY